MDWIPLQTMSSSANKSWAAVAGKPLTSMLSNMAMLQVRDRCRLVRREQFKILEVELFDFVLSRLIKNVNFCARFSFAFCFDDFSCFALQSYACYLYSNFFIPA